MEIVPFGNVGWVTTAIGDSTLMNEVKVGVGTALEAIEAHMLRRKVMGMNLVKAMVIGIEMVRLGQ